MFNSIYDAYHRELRTSIAKSLRQSRTLPEYKQSFDVFIPLWTLVDGIRDKSNAPNPTKAMLLSFFRESDNLPAFIKLSKDRHIERNFGVELQRAHEATLFTSYFDELISDSLLFVNAFHISNYRDCMIALRCMLEDLYRHLYYKDNQENFIRVHELGESEHQLRLSPAFFRKYLEDASFLGTINKLRWNFHVNGKSISSFQKLNPELYASTSSFVHGSSPSTLNGFASNTDFVFNANRANKILLVAKLVNALSVAFLSCAHLDQFSCFNESAKRIVMSGFEPSQRPAFRKAIRV